MALTTRPPVERTDQPPDDYLVEVAPEEAERTPVSHRIMRGAELLLIVVLAFVSFGVFWIVGLMLGIL